MEETKRNKYKVVDAISKFLNTTWGMLVVLLVIVIFAIIIRIGLMPFREVNGDTYWFQAPWTTYYRNHGGIKAIGELPYSYIKYKGKNYAYGTNEFELYFGKEDAILYQCDYLAGYLNLMVLFSYLPINSYRVCKYIGLMVDLATSIGILFVSWRVTNKNKLLSILASTLYLFLPTILTNSGIWGQCDGLYTCLIIWSLYFIISDRPWFSMMFIGFALATKLQGIFIIPLFGYLWIKKGFKLYWLAIIPIAMFVIYIPSLCGGMSFKTIFAQYSGQAGEYKNANYNSGSLYVIFSQYNSDKSMRASVDYFGIPLCLIALIGTLLILFYKKVEITKINIIGIGALFAVIFPFFLPHMHERYFFLADALIFLYCILNKKHYWLILTSQIASFNAYTYFLFGDYFLPTATFKQTALYLSMLLNVLSIAMLLKDLIDSTKIIENNNKVIIDN